VTVEEEVAEANLAFYGAFEARDLGAMGEVWEQSGRVAVTHPGWPTLRGFEKVLSSWRAIFANTPYIQFFLTDEEVTVDGDVAWISLYENILQEVPGSGDEGRQPELGDSRVAATNVFCRTDGRWRMVIHHGSPVARGFQPDGDG
jgi:ketosteroid isomerase-like protein